LIADKSQNPSRVKKSRIYRFGPYELSVNSEELRKHGILVRLAPQPFRVLLLLVQNAGKLVNREELHIRLWGEGELTVEFDAGLNRCIRQIRSALRDNADAPRYIETEPRRGYRFISPVELDEGIADEPSAATPIAELPLSAVSEVVVVPLELTTVLPEPPEVAAPPAPAKPAKPRSRILQAWSSRTFVLIRRTVFIVPFLVLLYLWKFKHPDQPIGTDMVPLATGLGEQYAPALSPNGKKVAFTWNPENHDNFDIYVKTINPPSAIRLTTDKDVDYSPAWSPDGRTIAFCRGSSTLGGAVWIIPATGGAEKKVVDLAAIAVPHTRGLSWMPDSKHLIVTEPLAPGNSAITLVDVVSGETKQLWNARPGEEFMFPAVSPDGKTIAYANDTGRGVSAIYLLPTTPDATPQVLPGLFTNRAFRSAYNAQPAWTPGGTHLVFASNVDGEGHLWISDRRAPPRVLAGLGNDLEDPNTSAAGQLAAGHVDYDRNIWRLETPGKTTATSHIPLATITSTRDDGEPSFSPDGSRLAFASDRGGFTEIWTASADGTNIAPLTNLRRPISGSPAWSPDGRFIAFDSRSGAHSGIYLVSSTGGSPQALDRAAGFNDVVPAWSPDGRWIYYSSDRTGRMEIWCMNPSGGTAGQVTHEGGFAAKLSPDGQFLYSSESNAPHSDLWQTDLHTRERTKIADSVVKRAYAPTKDGIYYFTHIRYAETALWFYNLKAKKNTHVFSTDRVIDGGVALSPNGRYLYYTQADSNTHDLLLAPNFWKP
jgi:Tol biopolymer transport system component/DNA-binding winged helix-turn-helix (wHTH) protein